MRGIYLLVAPKKTSDANQTRQAVGPTVQCHDGSCAHGIGIIAWMRIWRFTGGWGPRSLTDKRHGRGACHLTSLPFVQFGICHESRQVSFFEERVTTSWQLQNCWVLTVFLNIFRFENAHRSIKKEKLYSNSRLGNWTGANFWKTPSPVRSAAYVYYFWRVLFFFFSFFFTTPWADFISLIFLSFIIFF